MPILHGCCTEKQHERVRTAIVGRVPVGEDEILLKRLQTPLHLSIPDFI